MAQVEEHQCGDRHTYREQWEGVEAARWLQDAHGWLKVEGEWETEAETRDAPATAASLPSP